VSKIRICPISRGACGVDIKPDPQKLFVIMPFREEQAPQSLYHDILKALHDWNVSRVDEKYDIPDSSVCTQSWIAT
jgi:hypothetical protein